MKHTLKIFLILNSIFFFTFYAEAQEPIQGTITIKENCTNGKINDPSGGCLYKIHFYAEKNLTFDQAKAIAASKGWTLATADELTEAFNRLSYNQYSYGRLADGRFAVPVQSDHSNFKIGTNIVSQGGNQGFFYTIKPGTPVVPLPNANAGVDPSQGGTLNINTGPPIDQASVQQSIDNFYKQEFFRLNGMPYEGSQSQKYDRYEQKYNNGIGNIIQDQWNDSNYGPILNRALQAYVTEKFPNSFEPARYLHLAEYNKYLIQNKDPHCFECQYTRYEFVGFFVPEYLKMLRTGSNPTLKKEFTEYVSFHVAKASRKTLADWKYYSRRTSAQLNDQPYIPGLNFNNSTPVLADPSVFGTNTNYGNNTMSSVFISTAVPLPGKSVDEFKERYMNGSPFFFSQEQNLALMDFAMPLTAQSFPNDPDVQSIINVPNYFAKNLSEEAKALNIAKNQAIRFGTGASVGATALFGGFTLQAIQLSSKTATHQASALAQVAHNAAVEAAKIAGQQTGQVVHVEASKQVTKIAITNTAKLGNKAIGPLISKGLGPVASGVAVFVAGFMPTGGKAIEIAAFEDNLKKDCYIKDRQDNWMAISDGEKIENFSFLFKMLVLDAKDFTYLVPERKAGPNEQLLIEKKAADYLLKINGDAKPLHKNIMNSMSSRYNISEVHSFRKDGLSLAETQQLAAFHNWNIATPDQVYDAWIGGLDAYAYLRMSDGKFAVPVQSDHSNFKIGANINAKGGNQGFLYTVKNSDDYKRIKNRWKGNYIQNSNSMLGTKNELGLDEWKIIPASDGWVRFQNKKNPSLYLNFDGTKMEAAKIEPNWASALWKIHPAPQAGYSVIQSKWYPDKFIHNENGPLELGYTKSSWWSAMWLFE